MKSVDQILQYFNNLNQIDQNNFGDNITTPMECVKKMIDYIPEEFWQRKTISILDPCCGNGNFGAYCAFKTSLNNIHFNEINLERFKRCKTALKPKEITNKDAFELFSGSRKYDLIMANPPYSGARNKNKSISNRFIEGAIDILNEDGYLCFITPNNWMTFNNKNTTLKKLLSNGEFLIIDNDCKKFFPKVGSSFTILIWQKTKSKKITKVFNNFLIKDYQEVIIPKNIKFLPLYLNQQILSIINKSVRQERNNFKYRCDLHNFTKRDCLSDQKNNIYKYETIHTARKTRYATFKQDIYDKYLIIVPLSTYFLPYVKNNVNVTQSVGYIEFQQKAEAEKYLENLNQSHIKVLVHLTRYGNFNNTKLLKHLNFNKNIIMNKEETQIIKKLRSKINY